MQDKLNAITFDSIIQQPIIKLQELLTNIIQKANFNKVVNLLPMDPPGNLRSADPIKMEIRMIRAQFLESVENESLRNTSVGVLCISPHNKQHQVTDIVMITAFHIRSGFKHSTLQQPIICTWCKEPINPYIWHHYSICQQRIKTIYQKDSSAASRHRYMKNVLKECIRMIPQAHVQPKEPALRDHIENFQLKTGYTGTKDPLADLLVTIITVNEKHGVKEETTTKLLIEVKVTDTYQPSNRIYSYKQSNNVSSFEYGISAKKFEDQEFKRYCDSFEGITKDNLLIMAFDTTLHFSPGTMRVFRKIASLASNSPMVIHSISTEYSRILFVLKASAAISSQIWHAKMIRKTYTNFLKNDFYIPKNENQESSQE